MPTAAAPEVLTRLNVRVLGQGKPPLLCCNGFGCSQQVWRYLTAALATSHQLVLFDYPGTGGAEHRLAYVRKLGKAVVISQ